MGLDLGYLHKYNYSLQRSMAGTRDTEMAVGCWQPHFQGNNVFGDVHTFR